VGRAFSLPTGFPASRGDSVAQQFFNGCRVIGRPIMISDENLP